MTLVRIRTDKLESAVRDLAPTATDLQRIARGLGQAAVLKWKQLGQQGLKSTRRDYVQGIKMEPGKGGSVTVSLEGVVPNLIENGFPGGDMRRWMLKSPKARMGKNGPYLVVPFRHGSPGSSGANTGNPLPPSVHALAKKLAPTLSRPATPGGTPGAVKYGERMGPHLARSAKTRKLLTEKKKPWHTSNLYAGMIREEKKYAKATQNQYTTFRTISMHTNDPDRHWIHPGITPRRYARKVRDYLNRVSTDIVATALTRSK